MYSHWGFLKYFFLSCLVLLASITQNDYKTETLFPFCQSWSYISTQFLTGRKVQFLWVENGLDPSRKFWSARCFQRSSRSITCEDVVVVFFRILQSPKFPFVVQFRCLRTIHFCFSVQVLQPSKRMNPLDIITSVVDCAFKIKYLSNYVSIQRMKL